MRKKAVRRGPGNGKPLTELFAEAIVPVLAICGPVDTKRLYAQLRDRVPELCTNRGQDRPWVVWQRDARNALTYLENRGIIELIPTKGFERKGVYRLVNRGNS